MTSGVALFIGPLMHTNNAIGAALARAMRRTWPDARLALVGPTGSGTASPDAWQAVITDLRRLVNEKLAGARLSDTPPLVQALVEDIRRVAAGNSPRRR